MKREILEGRLNYKKQEFLQLLKENGEFIEFDQEVGYIYDFRNALARIRLSLKNGRILVHEIERYCRVPFLTNRG